jgi:hypothetical protein
MSLLMVGLLATSALAQAGSVAEAKRLADSLSQRQEMPINVRLRMQLLRDMMGGLAAKGDPSNALKFFSTTRVLAWNRPLNPETGQEMRAFEQQVVALSQAKGFNLDLPPVGYSTAGTAGGAQPLATSASSAPLLANRTNREVLAGYVLRAEEMGTIGLANGGSSQLQTLRDSLTVLRQDLADSEVATDAIRNVLLARAAYLASPAAAGADPQLLQNLDAAADALRSNFPAELLRQARGQQLRI